MGFSFHHLNIRACCIFRWCSTLTIVHVHHTWWSLLCGFSRWAFDVAIDPGPRDIHIRYIKPTSVIIKTDCWSVKYQRRVRIYRYIVLLFNNWKNCDLCPKLNTFCVTLVENSWVQLPWNDSCYSFVADAMSCHGLRNKINGNPLADRLEISLYNTLAVNRVKSWLPQWQ